jgi:uncharacterized protein (TIRG00374 family)
MKSAWRWLIAIAVTAALLWWALHEVDWSELRRDVANANVGLVLLAVFVSNLVFPLRALRWRPILDPVVPNVPYGALWRATAIGFMANHLLPFRAGEIVRPYMLSRDTTVPFSAAFASQVVDRVFDAFVVFLLVAVAMVLPDFPGGLGVRAFASTTAFGVGVVGVSLYLIVFAPARFIALSEFALRRLPPRFTERGRQMVRSFVEGLAVLRDPRRFVAVFLWALVMWLTQALAFWIMFRAIGISAPFSAALVIQGLIVLAVAAPSTPGFFGPFEAAAKAGLALYGVSNNMAIAWALPYHVLSLIPITVIGLWYLGRSGISFADLKRLRQ